jgi:hypothetical protein
VDLSQRRETPAEQCQRPQERGSPLRRDAVGRKRRLRGRIDSDVARDVSLLKRKLERAILASPETAHCASEESVFPVPHPLPDTGWMGIAIEKRFHSFRSTFCFKMGIPADPSALWDAVQFRNKDIVELLLK